MSDHKARIRDSQNIGKYFFIDDICCQDKTEDTYLKENISNIMCTI